ncbi:MAG: bifunctional glutamate N-acetyltransferase/amino-acid acetyltransferase ArgJ [Solirubrobacterales bacterium]|nr:bifunctional glutamate N-acetyltransferase/amino-acid acetyltransferase ArgJ [Solirubrobacterales bacterium]
MSFFRSRWVDRPAHVTELEPAALPAGFRAAGVHAGIKPAGEGGAAGALDVGLLVSDRDETVSAVRFCDNALVGAPVAVTGAARTDALRAVLANSGNSNVADGDRGLETARASQAAAAAALGIDADRVGLASTGVIGRELPRAALLAGAESCAAGLGADAAAFCEAILTTDKGPKRACLEVALPSGRTVRLAGQAKGAGMISPRFATMFCFVETDAALDHATLDLLTGVCVKRSFDRISVDGQLSTSDTVVAFANGAAGVEVAAESADELALGEAMDALLRQLALELVADGEGTTRVGRVRVRGAAEVVEPVARAVADSPLVKSALLGADPNFGRILQSVGQALGAGTPFVVDLAIEGIQVASAGTVLDLDAETWRTLERAVESPEVDIDLSLPGEGGETEVFFSDLTHEYVTINSEYST